MIKYLSKILLVSVLGIIFSNTDTFAQKRYYDVLWRGESIGQMTAEKSTKDDITDIYIQTDLSFTVGIRYNWVYKLRNKHYKDTLIHCTIDQIKNGTTVKSAYSDRSGKMYAFVKDGKTKFLKTERIYFTVAMLYFLEPAGRNMVYSETWGEYLPVKPLPNHHYKLEMPDGKSNIYKYIDGVCTEVLIQAGIVNFSLVFKH
jgi:hypothetical protein